MSHLLTSITFNLSASNYIHYKARDEILINSQTSNSSSHCVTYNNQTMKLCVVGWSHFNNQPMTILNRVCAWCLVYSGTLRQFKTPNKPFFLSENIPIHKGCILKPQKQNISVIITVNILALMYKNIYYNKYYDKNDDGGRGGGD